MDEFTEKVKKSLDKYNETSSTIRYKSINTSSTVKKSFSELNQEFIPISIIHKVNKMNEKSYVFSVNNTRCILTLLTIKNIRKGHVSFFVGFISKCILIMRDVFGKHLDEIHVNIALINVSKHLSSDKIITSTNINSGVSLTSKSIAFIPIIYVYRQEEICKVIVHEMLHTYRVHPFTCPIILDNILIEKHKIQQLPQRKSLNIVEAYVEAISVYINAIIYQEIFKDTQTFKKEMKHQLYLVNQLHNYKPYIETTNVFSYVFLKYTLLQNLDKLLMSLKKSNYCVSDFKEIMKYNDQKFEILPSSTKMYKRIRLSKMDIFKSI